MEIIAKKKKVHLNLALTFVAASSDFLKTKNSIQWYTPSNSGSIISLSKLITTLFTKQDLGN